METPDKTICVCEQVRTELALHAGGDLDDPQTLGKVEKHLAGCPHCRQMFSQLVSGMEVLQMCAANAASVPRTSLWPALARRLPVTATYSAAAAQFNFWVPTAAMTAACAAMLVVTVVQFNRGMPSDTVRHPQFSSSSARNLFVNDREFAAGRRSALDHSRDLVPVRLPADPSQW